MLDKEHAEHRPEIVSSFLGNEYTVLCSCGFEVNELSSREAAEDTVKWHLGQPSALGGDA